MVPGLDLDYSAEEEQPIESEFVEEVPTSAEHDPAEDPRQDFNWLLELSKTKGSRLSRRLSGGGASALASHRAGYGNRRRKRRQPG